MADDIAWDLYRTFLAVLTEGSLSGAARALGITQPTAGRHIEALEAALDQRLFIRTPTGLAPTPTAQALRGPAQDMRSLAAALARAASSRGAGVSGTVRISASEVIGVEVLPPALAQLQRAHPRLRIELVPTDRVQDLLRSEADIAVRMVEPQQGQLIARRVGEVELGMYAREDYLRERGTPATRAELAKHVLIGFDELTPFVRRALKSLPELTRESFSLRTSSDVAAMAMLRAGCGIGAIQCVLAERDPRMVRVLPGQWVFRLPVWVTMHEDLRDSPRCKVTFDALVACLETHVAGPHAARRSDAGTGTDDLKGKGKE
jgi:DNA-binding transcriptional LysR family regulator